MLQSHVLTWDGGYALVTHGRIPSDTETSTPASFFPDASVVSSVEPSQ